MAALCSVPVEIVVSEELSGSGRPSATVESTIYFLVSEALTNVSKHSSATRAGVSVRRSGPTIEVIVDDDGSGGACAKSSGGLAGLSDRLSGVDGNLTIDSPVGGPTRLYAEVPCV